jgi:hypothetical protein
LGLIYNKVTSRSYSYFQKIEYFYFLRNWFFQVCRKLQSLVEKTQGILGIKLLSIKLYLLMANYSKLYIYFDLFNKFLQCDMYIFFSLVL